MQTSQMRQKYDTRGRMCFVHVYLLLFLLMVMIGKVEPGGAIPSDLCSGEDLKIQMNHTHIDTAVAINVFYNGKEIAKSSDVSSMEWDKNLKANYGGRLSFTNQRDITVTLTNVSYEDTGFYRIVTKSLKGIARYEDWNITVLVPPSLHDAVKNNITKMRVNDSCSKLTCGNFSSLGKPKVTFNWNVSESKNQTVTVCNLQYYHCGVGGPAAKCLKTPGNRWTDHPSKTAKLSGGNIAWIIVPPVVLCCMVACIAFLIYKRRRKTKIRKKRRANVKEVAQKEEDKGLTVASTDNV